MTITYSHNFPHPSINSPWKRLVDIIGSLLGLSVLTILFIPITIGIKLNSPGSIFFTQKRYGLYGRTFTIYKFRSMVSNAHQLKDTVDNQATGAFFKNQQDPRITRVGKFLRQTSLDEFPQFWNVLRGDMSLVGTRPPTSDEVIHYNTRHWQRLNIKPGITGEWQVYGRSQVMDFEAVVDLDLRYQRRWSIWYDLHLIFQTIYVVFLQTGAY